MCQGNGVSIANGKIPVAPGCHFLMGGIVVIRLGRTSFDGLYAIGETACTGVHGANRLASNSLLEALHYGEKLAKHFNELQKRNATRRYIWSRLKWSCQLMLPLPDKDEIRAEMMA